MADGLHQEIAGLKARLWADHRVHLVVKRGRFWGLLSRILFWVGKLSDGRSRFLHGYHTTIGPVIGITEDRAAGPVDADLLATIRHELTHVNQARWCGLGSAWLGLLLFGPLYLLAPLPVGLALFRFAFEFQAYAEGEAERVRQGGSARVLNAAYQLTSGVYGYPLPPFMRGIVHRWIGRAIQRRTGGLL